MKWLVRQSTVAGTSPVPGDKSLAHRSLMFAALAEGSSRIENLPGGGDVAATAACMAALGVEMNRDDEVVEVTSDGDLRAPTGPLDARNSGTTMRLMAGILAGQSFPSRLEGDASLSRRPMGRIVEPLARMGATIRSREGHAPLDITGSWLHGIDYTLPVASAQVKSAVLLAGLLADGTTRVHERIPSRDHTERMLRALAVPVQRSNGSVELQGGSRPRPFSFRLPGDISSAAFLWAAAALTDGSVEIPGVGVNGTRTGFLTVLRQMGASVELRDQEERLGEPVATVRVSGRISKPVEIRAEDVPLLVDELPLVALLATQADGVSTVRGAEELRVKESDRIAGAATALSALGADIEERPDGFVVRGPTPLRGATLDSDGDHRLAMMVAVAGMAASGTTTVTGAEAATISFPRFVDTLRLLGGRIDVA